MHTPSTLTNMKKPFHVIYCLYKWISLVMCSKRIVIGPRKWCPCQTSWNENLQWMQNWTAKSTHVEEHAGKIETVFVIRAALWAEKLGRCLEYCGSWKSTLGKPVVAVNTGGHWIWGVLVTVEIFVFCGWWFSNQFDVVSETHFSCIAVGRELWLAILCVLLCPEADWNICIGKQGSVFILTP